MHGSFPILETRFHDDLLPGCQEFPNFIRILLQMEQGMAHLETRMATFFFSGPLFFWNPEKTNRLSFLGAEKKTEPSASQVPIESSAIYPLPTVCPALGETTV